MSDPFARNRQAGLTHLARSSYLDDMAIYDYTGLDIEEALRAANEEGLWQALHLNSERNAWETALRGAQSKGNAEDAVKIQGWLDELPPMTAVQGLAVITRLTDLLSGRRWYTIQRAREEGASWSEIGAAMNMSKQGAQDWYSRKIAAQERYVGDLHDSERARAALVDGKEEP